MFVADDDEDDEDDDDEDDDDEDNEDKDCARWIDTYIYAGFCGTDIVVSLFFLLAMPWLRAC